LDLRKNKLFLIKSSLKPALIDSGLYLFNKTNNTSTEKLFDLYNNNGNSTIIKNDEQILRINRMAQIMYSVSGSSSVLLGIFLDIFGRKFINFTFGIIFIISQILFGLSNENFQLYIPSFTLIGIGNKNFKKSWLCTMVF
jgi:MFS family permease